MGIFETAIIYTLIGFAIAASLALAREAPTTLAAGALFVVHTIFWPFFAPILLGEAVETRDPPTADSNATDEAQLPDVADPKIRRTEAQLLSALDRVGGIAEELLGPQMESVRNLSSSLARMDERIAEMDTLLKSSEFDRQAAEQALEALLDDPSIDDGDERIESVRSRLRNIDRLQKMRRLATRDLQRALLKMEEMNSQILLLQFADQPEGEIAQNIQEIASTIDGLSEGLLLA